MCFRKYAASSSGARLWGNATRNAWFCCASRYYMTTHMLSAMTMRSLDCSFYVIGTCTCDARFVTCIRGSRKRSMPVEGDYGTDSITHSDSLGKVEMLSHRQQLVKRLCFHILAITYCYASHYNVRIFTYKLRIPVISWATIGAWRKDVAVICRMKWHVEGPPRISDYCNN